jgi:hypothetical protein
MDEEKLFSTPDVNLSTVLIFQGCPPVKVEKNDRGRVYFSFTADSKLYQILDLYNRDIPLPINSFISCLKATRGLMLKHRDGAENG